MQTTIHDQLKALNENDDVVVRTDERTVSATVIDHYYAADEGYADGEVAVQLEAEWGDVKDVCSLEGVEIHQRTDYSGQWTDASLTGWVWEVDEENIVVEEEVVSLGTVENIERE